MNSGNPQPTRPDPDRLLSQAERVGRGRLRLFLGAAPGVGKTYEMLRTARQLRHDDIDIVVGVVETHGRVETARLLTGLEIIPRCPRPYKDRWLEEMDLDAILARRPALVLVDELAHTNAPGSRHPKRYQDVEELLDAGIDVFSTLNIQHIESLNDIVARITRIRVRETVPDSIIDRADEIELVDVTPETLRRRLIEGKVYVRDQAQRALKHYFSAGNLTALRDLALRRTADRVEAQMRDFMQTRAISGPWQTGERLLVAIDDHPTAEHLIRHARRLADRLRCAWIALHIDVPRPFADPAENRERLSASLRLAEQLGAETITLPGSGIAAALLSHAQAHNVSQILVGVRTRPWWRRWRSGPLSRELLRRSRDIAVHVIPLPDQPNQPAGNRDWPTPPPAAWLETAAITAGSTVLALALDRLINPGTLSLIFLIGVVLIAIRRGLLASLSGSVVAMLAYNFFFLPPLYTFTIADPANVVALVAFFVSALITSQLAAHSRAQAQSAARRAKITADLYNFSRKLAAIGSLDDVLWVISYQIAAMLTVHTLVLLPTNERLTIQAGYPPEDKLDPDDLAAADWAWRNGQETGRGSATLPGARWLFVPLRTESGCVGVLGLNRPDRDQIGSRPILARDERQLLDALVDQAAIAIERIALAETVEETKILAATEKLRSALLNSISHDFRTPLASILGSVTSLRQFAGLHDENARTELLTTIQDEAERLNRFVGNLLDFMRLESGTLTGNTGPVDLAEAVGTALRRSAGRLAGHRVERHIPADLPLVQADHVLLEQILVNLLDNAAKYAPVGSTITLLAQRGADGIDLIVDDQGPGIPPDRRQRVFDRFEHHPVAGAAAGGVGLGLAICQGFVEVMGGRILADAAPGGGARLIITLPEASGHEQPADDSSDH